jgi:hypothetical protein
VLLQRGAEGYMEARPANASWTAVHEAARNGHLACLRLLLRNGASPETVSRSGCNALMVAAAGSRAGHLECLRCLLGQAGMVAQRRAAARQELRAAVAAIADVVQLAKGVARRVEEWLPRRARAEEAEREVAAAAARQQSLFKREKLAVKTLKVAAHSTLLGYGGGSNNSPLLRWGFAAWTCLWLRGAAMRQKERYKHAAAENECGEFVLGIIPLTKLTLTLTLTHGHHHMCVIWVVPTDEMHKHCVWPPLHQGRAPVAARAAAEAVRAHGAAAGSQARRVGAALGGIGQGCAGPTPGCLGARTQACHSGGCQRMVQPPPRCCARYDGCPSCLNDAPCPQFTSHSASLGNHTWHCPRGCDM